MNIKERKPSNVSQLKEFTKYIILKKNFIYPTVENKM